MSDDVNSGDVIVAADAESLAATATHLLRAWVSEVIGREDRPARVAISGGSTPRAMFRRLANVPFPWERCEWFWVDERAVPADNPRSNFGAANEDLFSRVPVPPPYVHPLVPTSPDLEAVARGYQQLLAERFRIGNSPGTVTPAFDVLFLGIGDDGHTASLFPHYPEIDVTDRWVVPVTKVAPGGRDPREPRLTLTRPVIEAASRVVMLVQDESKREVVRRAREPGPLHEVPSRLTQNVRGEMIWLVDSAARP